MDERTISVAGLNDGEWLLGSPGQARGRHLQQDGPQGSRAVVFFAEGVRSAFAESAQLAPSALSRSIAIDAVWLSRDATVEDDLAPALYRALQAGRVLGCSTVVAHVPSLESQLAHTMQLAELNAHPATHAGNRLMASAQMLDIAIHSVSQRCSKAGWAKVQPELAAEAVQTVREWVPRFYQGSWARSILERTMTRQQYIQSLSNMHHYVRQTTQHLGRAIANTEDRNLRRHFIQHLNGEINHEVMIENDLRYLGVDPEYVMKHRVPSPATKAFMAIQETSIAYYHDPLMLMACPLVAEGVTANMPEEFVTSLRDVVGSWGVEAPARATGFLTSHTHTDSGEDGHWQATVEMLRGCLVDEAIQRRFLCTLRTAADCIERSFNSNIDEIPLFATAS